MADAVLEVAKRSERGTRMSRRLRASGRVPAILYRQGADPSPISVDERSLRALLRHGAHGLLNVNVDGKQDRVVIREMQWDPFGAEILHVDFAAVAAGERLTMNVPVKLQGDSPGVAAGGVLEHVLHELEVTCDPSNVPDELVVGINELGIDQSITVKDLDLGKGVEPSVGADQVVVQVKPAADEQPEDDEPGAAEPEVIGRSAAAEEDS